MKILAIETSCDETAVAILDAKGRLPAGRQGLKNPRFQILSNIVASQVKIHAPWGGVVPNLAKREHQKNLPIILKKALREAGLISKSPPDFATTKSLRAGKFLISKQIQNSKFKIPNIDLIAVTNGPGLEPCLWTGINFAEELAKKWKNPLIGINHLEGHIYSVFLHKSKPGFDLVKFPVIALVVSGGHTQLVLMKKWLNYKLIGETLDDAAGEAFDKVARLLKLGYPGGPVIAAEAAKIRNLKSDRARLRQTKSWRVGIRNKSQILNSKFQIKLPRPMINSKDYNFSFSGLKTAVLYKIKELGELTPNIKTEMAHEFQQAVIDVLIKKTIRAAKEYRVKTIILGGGVVANKELRKKKKKRQQIPAIANIC